MKIKESNLEIFLLETQFGCPVVFNKINQILSIYYKNYNDDISCKEIEQSYKETLSTLINILTKKKDYKTIGCILYQGYTTNEFHLHKNFHDFIINENILDLLLSNENKDINDFIKNIPTILESFQRLIKKSKYPAKLEKMLNQLRTSIPLNIYNKMTNLIIGG